MNICITEQFKNTRFELIHSSDERFEQILFNMRDCICSDIFEHIQKEDTELLYQYILDNKEQSVYIFYPDKQIVLNEHEDGYGYDYRKYKDLIQIKFVDILLDLNKDLYHDYGIDDVAKSSEIKSHNFMHMDSYIRDIISNYNNILIILFLESLTDKNNREYHHIMLINPKPPIFSKELKLYDRLCKIKDIK